MRLEEPINYVRCDLNRHGHGHPNPGTFLSETAKACALEDRESLWEYFIGS